MTPMASFKDDTYRAFHGFGQDKFPVGGSVLGLSQFTLLPGASKTMLDLKKV